ncbi:MAG: virulence-associated E family protein [Bacillota bacterium]|nr:virulence-associated E family protein [Bacillota bacterium]MDW7685298.1 virulence-associated E family protein [Bacillota bacterium]
MRELKIAYGNSRFAKKWSNKTITFDELCKRLENTVRTSETVEEYPHLPKKERDGVKDKGGFVGGWLKNGRRKREMVDCRSMLTLDGDKVAKDFISHYERDNKYTFCLYSTHGHTPEEPRLRIIIPLTRDITSDEYAAITRYYAADWEIDQFDECSYRPHQLMYWPTTPSNGEYIFKRLDGQWLDPDKYLAEHPNWRDCSQLPTSSRESAVISHEIKHQADPLSKDGIIGAFNNAYYPIQTLIESELSDIYEPAEGGRYGYIPADSTAGVVVYDDKFVYSNHASDPAYAQLLNAFDLYRVHRFGHLEETKSVKAMLDYAQNDEAVKRWLAKKRTEKAKEEFDAVISSDDNWQSQLEVEKNGKVKDTLDNLVIILDNDPNVAVVGYNELKSSLDFLAKPVWEPIKYPSWTDNDTSQLRVYLSNIYGIYSPNKTQDALNMVAAKRKHHPIRKYLKSLPPWDGSPRVETLLIDYLGADDTSYVRAVTRKTIVAAVARVFVPGIKFDSVLVMDGPQEKGKSTLFNRLAGDEWFNDGLTLTDMQDKAGAEKLQGYWILEIGELTGMRKSDIDSVKSFISRRDDKYRASYGRVVESHPRQSIIVATVNSTGGFLRDPTGNRRFWPVKTPGGTKKHSWDITEEDVKQIWAEALVLWKQGEKLYLEGSVKESAVREQNAALETDPREGMVRDYLERLLPENWADYDIGARRSFLHGTDFGKPEEGTVEREFVCPMEIWAECYAKDPALIKKADSYEIGVVLRKLGWISTESRKRIPIYGQQRMWERDKN